MTLTETSFRAVSPEPETAAWSGPTTASADLPDPLLRIAGVSLEYRTPARVVRAAHRIDLDVYEADRFVLLGPSGCGKSTLLKAVAVDRRRRVIPPDAAFS